MLTELDESDPVKEVIRATLIVVGVTPGALALFPVAVVAGPDGEPPVGAPVVALVAAPPPEAAFLELPQAVAANTTVAMTARAARRPE